MIIRRIILIFALLIILPVSSCNADNTETILYRIADTTYNGYEFYAESFTFLEHSNPEREDTPIKEKTGYRVVQKNLETGAIKCACIDPVCNHSIEQSCPVVSRYEITSVQISNGCVFFFCDQGSKYYSELKCYNLSSGEIKTIFKESNDAAEDSFIVADTYVWFTVPDVVDKKICYTLNKYDLNTDKVQTLRQFDEAMVVQYVTDKRVYVSRHPLSVGNPEEYNIVSYTYDGGEEREESYKISDARLIIGCTIYSNVHLDIGTILTGYSSQYVKYDFSSRKLEQFPLSGDSIVSIGYRKSDNRIYYISNEEAETVFTLNPITRANELGITYTQLMADSEELEKLNNDMTKALFGSKSYLKSCNIDGSDVKTLYEFPEGSFFHSADYNQITGCISDDGTKYYVKEEHIDENGNQVTEAAAIIIDTGEITYEK